MTKTLSSQARDALIAVGTNRQGATIPRRSSDAVAEELRDAGLVGRDLGLTRRGTIERERLVSALLDAAF